VLIADGTTVSMPDTPANQAAYPQQGAQQPGVGFPIVRLVTLLSLASGMLRDVALGPYAGKEGHETALSPITSSSAPTNRPGAETSESPR
jgi:hypothetical protein